jgi:hypothetical protein
MANPLSDTHLSLKQVDVSALGELEQSVLTATLSAYGIGHSDDQIREGTARLSRMFSGIEVQFDSSGGRRFAGDRTLPRTRYFSLVDGAGSDERTLLQEMSAYLIGSTYPGLVSLFDSDGANTMELLGILADIPKRNYAALDLTVPSLLIAVRPLIADPMLRDAYGKATQYAIQVPYQLSDRTLAGVLDLRQPAARTWLVAQFSRTIRLEDKEFPVLLGRDRPDNFEQILPSLLDQWLGGGLTTGNMAGLFARQAGANGLIYPSARSNARVELTDNLVMDSVGWCFVSYENAPDMETNAQFSIASDKWPIHIGWSPQPIGWVQELIPLKNTEIDYVRSGPRAGSFEVRGLAEYNRALYRLSQVTGVLDCIDQELGVRVSSRLAYMALYSAAEDLAWICGVLLGALLGDVRSLARLEVATSSAGSDFERETYADARKLITRVPASFRATGSLAKALGFSSAQQR